MLRLTSPARVSPAPCYRTFLSASSAFFRKRFTTASCTAECRSSGCNCGANRTRFILESATRALALISGRQEEAVGLAWLESSSESNWWKECLRLIRSPKRALQSRLACPCIRDGMPFARLARCARNFASSKGRNRGVLRADPLEYVSSLFALDSAQYVPAQNIGIAALDHHVP